MRAIQASSASAAHSASRSSAPGHAQPGQAADVARAPACTASSSDSLLSVEQFGIGQRAGRDHAHHLALDRPLAGADLADLLADRHRFAELDQPRQVGVDRSGTARRPSTTGCAGRLAALGERDVEQARGLFGVGVEQLVEVAHPVEQQRVGMVGLEAQVLRHHGRVRGQVGVLRDGCWNVFLHQ